MSAAMLSAIGIITIAVAVLLIRMPMNPVTSSRPASRLGRFHAA